MAHRNNALGSTYRLMLESANDGIYLVEPGSGRIMVPNQALFTTKGARGGTGLGLFTVHRIVREHEGEIEISSVGGQGTTFSIRLPRWGA